MSKTREIIRYGCATELSERPIARALEVSGTAVGRAPRAFRGRDLDCAAVETKADSQLLKRLECERPASPDSRSSVLATPSPQMVLELKKKGMTLQYLWEQYINEHPDGYQYSQFRRQFYRWRAADEVTMHIEHRAGEAMLVDWAGDKPRAVNGHTGEPSELEQLVPQRALQEKQSSLPEQQGQYDELSKAWTAYREEMQGQVKEVQRERNLLQAAGISGWLLALAFAILAAVI